MKRIKEFFNKKFKLFSWGLTILVIILYILPYMIDCIPKEFQGDYKLYLLILLVIIHLIFLVDRIELIDEKLKKPYNISCYHEYSTYIIDKIETTAKKEARLIEYSTSSIKDILEALDKKEFKVKLLIQSPENAISRFQKRKIWTAMCDFHIYLQNYSENFEVRCYKNTASLRGRHIGENISIGHYLYHKQQNSEKGEFDSIVGHAYPMISFEQYTQEGKILLKFFDDFFDELWKSAEPVGNVCEKCKEEYKEICPKVKNYT